MWNTPIMSLDRLEGLQIFSLHGTRRRMQILEKVLSALFVVIMIHTRIASADRVSDKIYSVVQSDHYCGRRLNATHQMGCSSKLGGNIGIVWIVKQQRDLDHVLRDGPTPPYMVVLRRGYYTRENLLKFKANPDRVSGVVFFDTDHADPKTRVAPFSPEDRCPNRFSGLYVNDTQYENCKRNVWQKESPISGLLYEDIPYPIFLLNDKQSIESIETCFNDNNALDARGDQSNYPLCGLHLDSFMVAAMDTETCLNSHSLVDELLQSNGRRCEFVNNQNIFAYLKPTSGTLHRIGNTDKFKPEVLRRQSIVLLVTKLSSISMFTELSPGADSTITSIVALLAVADALNKVRSNPDVVKSERNLAFALMDSEPFDFTGSNRMIHEMESNNFPYSYYILHDLNKTEAMQNMNLSSIDYVINLDQLSLYPEHETVYLHSGPHGSGMPDKLKRVIQIMEEAARKSDLKLEPPTDLPLPPVSVQEFVKSSTSLPADERLMGLALTNYGREFNNLYYHSVYDDAFNIDQTSRQELTNHLWRVANFIARSLYRLTFGVEPNDSEVEVDKNLVEQLLYCYLSDASCHLFTKAWQASQQLPKGPIQTYKDPIKKSDDMNGAITANLLSYLTRTPIDDQGLNITRCYEENEKSLVFNYQFINGRGEPVKDLSQGVCIKSQVLMVSSISPAFEPGDGIIKVNKTFPAWTASLNSIRNPARLYLKPSPTYEYGLFLTGVITTMIAFVIVNHVSRVLSSLRSDSESLPGTST